MPISFDQIPANWRMPLYWVEVDESQAGLPIVRQPGLIVGSMIAATPTPPSGVIAGVGVPDVPKPIGTQAQADNEYGPGSELASMVRAWLRNNFAQELWCLPVLPLLGSTAAQGTITINSIPTEAGMFHLYIAGHYVGIVVGTTDTTALIATNLSEAINDDLNLPVYATVATSVVTVHCKTPGINGNDITLMANYYGKVGGQEFPPGFRVTMPAQLTGGAGVPNFDNAIANLGEREFDFVALPHTDSNTLFDWELEYGFSDQGRWGWLRQLYGQIFCAKRGTYSDLVIFGLTRNAPHYEWAAAYAAKAARAYTNDPARPLQTLKFTSLLPAQGEDRFILPELNSLSGVGMATQAVKVPGVAQIMRETTNWQVNEWGFSDDGYTDATTLATLTRLIRDQRHAITSKFPRHKLANNDTRFGAGQKIVTPNIIKAELVAQYRVAEFNGLVENVAAFKEHLIVERNISDPTRIDVLWPPDLINALRVFAVLAQFRLQYSRSQDLEIQR